MSTKKTIKNTNQATSTQKKNVVSVKAESKKRVLKATKTTHFTTSSTKSVKRVKDEDSSHESRSIDDVNDLDNVDNINDNEENENIEKEELVRAVPKTNHTGGLKDLKKIVEDPEEYARGITVERLVNILQKMSDFYYNEARPLVDDEVYDVMVDVLKERDPNNAYLFQTGVAKTTDKDVDLPFAMPSLDKMKPGDKALIKFFKVHKGPFMFMDKLDGISLQDYKDSKGNDDLFTKKQTGMGTSKKHLMKYLIPKKRQADVPNNTSIRGEMVISRKDFEDVKKIDPSLKNERSVMSGLVNTDKIDSRIADKAQFVTYGILSADTKIGDQLDSLDKIGFKTVWHKEYTLEELKEHDDIDSDDDPTGIKAIEANLKDILAERRAKSEFLTDGLVVTDNSKGYPHTDANPKHSLAFKMNSTTGMKDVIVEEVIWEPTMYSYLQPVVRTKPVILSGNTSCTHFTAHNAKYVYDNKIGKGATIKVVRSGDVIPYIVSVVKPAKKADMPDMKYEWNDTEVDIIVINPSKEISRLINIKRNLHLFRKIRVKFLSEKTMAKLYDAGYESIASIVAAASNKDTEPYNIGGLGEKMITKIYNQIDRAFENVKLQDLMAGSLKFGHGLGATKMRDLLKMYPDVLSMKDDDVDDIEEKIMKVPGFSHNLAGKFATNLKAFSDFLEELRENSDYDLEFKPPKKVVDVKAKTTAKTGTKAKKAVKDNIEDEDMENVENVDENVGDYDMSNQVVVMTGFRSDEINEFVEKHGGRMATSVSGKTTMVVYDKLSNDSTKLTKARDLGIKVMTRQEFETKYGL